MGKKAEDGEPWGEVGVQGSVASVLSRARGSVLGSCCMVSLGSWKKVFFSAIVTA